MNLVDPTPGTLIGARLRLIEPIGRGAMGAVWIAEHLTLETRVAVKLIAPEHAPDDREIRERFKREAKATARIKSHHVVQTFDRGVTDEGVPYIVLELLDGESLQAQLDRDEHLAVGETAQIVTHVGRALNSAHAVGIIHRDIKPGNIFRTHAEQEPLYKVLDFGVAKLTRTDRVTDVSELFSRARPERGSPLTVLGSIVGTPEFMSPERLGTDDPACPQDDLWALGIVAYQCLTGRLPFRGDDVEALSLAVMLGEYEPPSTHVPALAPDVDRWFERAFAAMPSQRFASPDEMASDFAALVRTTPVSDDEPASAPAHDGGESAEQVTAVVRPATHSTLSVRSNTTRTWAALGVVGATVLVLAYAFNDAAVIPNPMPRPPTTATQRLAPEPTEVAEPGEAPATPTPGAAGARKPVGVTVRSASPSWSNGSTRGKRAPTPRTATATSSSLTPRAPAPSTTPQRGALPDRDLGF